MKPQYYILAIICLLLFFYFNIISKHNHDLVVSLDSITVKLDSVLLILDKDELLLSKNTLPCPICGSTGELHQATNDIEHPMWIIDCTSNNGCTGSDVRGRVLGRWYPSQQAAIIAWNSLYKKLR